jgi:hypothetical protein
MNKYPFDGLIGSEQHRRRYIDSATGSRVPRTVARAKPEGNEYMFLEDLRMRALPYGRGSDEGFRLDVHPSDEKVLDLVRDALPALRYRHGQIDESFRDYIQSALPALAQGNLYLEIEYFRDPGDQAGRPVAFRIDFLRPELVVKRYGKYRYLVPTQAEVEENKRWSSDPLDPRCLVVVSLPRRLRRELDRTLRVIRAAGQDLSVLLDFTNGVHGNNSGFNFSTYQRISHDIVLRASKSTGWAGRGAYTEDLLDPEKAWRAIQFARIVVRLREIAMQGLQDAIDRAGAEIGFTAKLKLSKVVTLDYLDRMERDLEAGTRPIGEIFAPKAPA